MAEPGAGLTDFLLARIAEDEALVPAHYVDWRPPHRRLWVDWDEDSFTVYSAPERWRAESEAKRRIVAWADAWLDRGAAPWNEDLLRLLALPYADHPDYREEWRP